DANLQKPAMNENADILADRVQLQLESMYGIGLPQRARDYLIGRKEAQGYVSTHYGKMPKELFLVRKSEESSVEVALFLDLRLLTNLKKNNPFISLSDKNFSDFCILIEGVSHFVYFLWKAHHDVPITQLEMELQAEIDKFLMLFFYLRADNAPEFPQKLLESLFEDFRLIEKLSEESEGRYLTASTLASRYCYHLQKKFRKLSDPAQVREMLEEIRQFYNLSQEDKIRYIVN
ncbi:MAG: hypothetical protein Q7T11_08625, partial [Deltaproteobacteria bacterium]|nr:hypothetical protein [Deltaproteobacteria bacterium]